MINGVEIIPLEVFPNEQGKVMKMISKDDPFFEKFGEIYFSEVNPGFIKGWHRQKITTKNYVVISGSMKLVLFDGKELQAISLGVDNYCLVKIPPGIWSSFKAQGNKPAIIADLMDMPHDPKDGEKADLKLLTNYWDDE